MPLSARRCCTAPLVKGVIARPVRKLVVGSELSAAGGRGSAQFAPHIGPHAGTSCNPSVGAECSCPPSCQPTDGHCRGRQSGHFLEIASLHPPLAALRRFPRPVLAGKPCPARSPHTAVLRFSPARGRCSTITAQSSPRPLRHRDSSNISAASSRASVPVKPASRFSSHSSQL